jgi:hypothetical protein
MPGTPPSPHTLRTAESGLAASSPPCSEHWHVGDKSGPLSHSKRPPSKSSFRSIQRIREPASHPTAHSAEPKEPVPQARRLFPAARLQCKSYYHTRRRWLRNCKVDRRQIVQNAAQDRRAGPKSSESHTQIRRAGRKLALTCRGGTNESTQRSSMVLVAQPRKVVVGKVYSNANRTSNLGASNF